ncbi:acyl carrier protein [Flavobacterium sp. Leaf82]|jgi:acyl carrier protein|uniref:phosphopantetheine-binding protein n=1 Tax=unclassified Flavobacterium TaxID=196869 RepID=UPI0006F7ADFC|nr:phosphopantetheine-binding protein [Flavobacterium sp. Leaf82]KQO33260.1 acyl carrier protein [Flavobacterium sp. Leaf82]
MEDFLEKMAELFEEDSVQLSDNIVDFDAWDSLTSLSVIAYSGEEFQKTITAAQIVEAKTIGGLYELLKNN